MVHEKAEVIAILIAIVCSALATFLAGYGRVKIAVSREAHARVAEKAANEKLIETSRDIVALRRQIAKLTAENDELSGRLFLEKPDGGEWEAGQSLLEQAAARIDAEVESTPPSDPPVPRIPESERGKLIFRKGPMEIGPDS